MNKDDIINNVSDDLGYDPKLVRFVINNMWQTIRYYLNNPLETKRGIKINRFMKFYIKPYRIKKFLSYTKNTTRLKLLNEIKNFIQTWPKTNKEKNSQFKIWWKNKKP